MSRLAFVTIICGYVCQRCMFNVTVTVIVICLVRFSCGLSLYSITSTCAVAFTVDELRPGNSLRRVIYPAFTRVKDKKGRKQEMSGAATFSGSLLQSATLVSQVNTGEPSQHG